MHGGHKIDFHEANCSKYYGTNIHIWFTCNVLHRRGQQKMVLKCTTPQRIQGRTHAAAPLTFRWQLIVSVRRDAIIFFLPRQPTHNPRNSCSRIFSTTATESTYLKSMYLRELGAPNSSRCQRLIFASIVCLLDIHIAMDQSSFPRIGLRYEQIGNLEEVDEKSPRRLETVGGGQGQVSSRDCSACLRTGVSRRPLFCLTQDSVCGGVTRGTTIVASAEWMIVFMHHNATQYFREERLRFSGIISVRVCADLIGRQKLC